MDPELTWTFDTADESVVITGALSREEGENAGSYAITQGTLSAGEEYEIVFVSAELTIRKADAAVVRAPEAITAWPTAHRK